MHHAEDVPQNITMRAADGRDFASILALQTRNLACNLDGDKASTGYLSAEFTDAHLEQVIRELGIVVACVSDVVVAYLMAESLNLACKFPTFNAMMKHFEPFVIEGKMRPHSEIFAFGPVCIDAPYRGTGLLRGLYRTMGAMIEGRFSAGVAFTSLGNLRSRDAHLKGMQFESLGEFSYDTERYLAIGWCLES